MIQDAVGPLRCSVDTFAGEGLVRLVCVLACVCVRAAGYGEKRSGCHETSPHLFFLFVFLSELRSFPKSSMDIRIAPE